MADEKEDPITVQEVEVIAQKRLLKNVHEYYACGSDEQTALQRNTEAFSRLVHFRVLMIVASR